MIKIKNRAVRFLLIFLSLILISVGFALLNTQALPSGDFWKNFLSWLGFVHSLTWFLVIGRIALAVFAAWLLAKIFSRLRRNEAEISRLAREMEEACDKNRKLDSLRDQNIPLPLPETESLSQQRLALEIAHPHLSEFVKEARNIGLSDLQIKTELAQAGWDFSEISLALKI